MRMVKGLASLILLVAVVAGIPWLLVEFGRADALVERFPAVLLTPDDGTVLLALLTVVGWVLWALFTLSLVAELVAVISRQRVRIRLPGLARPQSLVAGLLLAVVTMVSIPMGANAHASGERPADATTSSRTVESPASASAPGDGKSSVGAAAEHPDPTDSVRHRVQRGDDLWSLAEHYYGDGLRWTEIHRANADLISQPDQIDVGWNLLIPHVAGDARDARSGDGAAQTGAEGAAVDEDQVVAPETADPVVPVEPPVHVEPTRPAPPTTGSTASDDAAREHPAPPGDTTPTGSQPAGAASGVDTEVAIALAGSVGAFLAAGVVGTLAVRRRAQLAVRPAGRRIVLPPARAMEVESALDNLRDPRGLELLDLAMRAIGHHCRAAGRTPPELERVVVTADSLTFVWTGRPGAAPHGFLDEGTNWRVDRGRIEFDDVPDLASLPCPWPTLICLGYRQDGAAILVELERRPHRFAGNVAAVTGSLNSALIELCCAPWHAELAITAIGLDDDFIAAIDLPEVRAADDLDTELDRLEQRSRRRNLALAGVGADGGTVFDRAMARRLDPDIGPDWAPELLLLDDELSPTQQRRLAALMSGSAGLAVVTTEEVVSLDAEVLTFDSAALHLPGGTRLRPQVVIESARQALTELMAASADGRTTPAPWWHHEPPPPEGNGAADPAGGAPDVTVDRGADPTNVTPILAARSAGRIEEPAIVEEHRTHHPQHAQPDPEHPVVALIGPVELHHARGPQPSRAINQCIEYCAWLLEHPGASAVTMRNSLIVAEGTRRSNTSRLRGWLGSDPAGEPYLPDAYSGRITLHSGVSSDWQRLQLLIVGGANRAGQRALIEALQLVRGAPLADAAPGQWHWAEELRIDISSTIRDIGVALAGRALADNDIDLARWATARALTAAPEDELLLCARIRAEHQAGNRVEVERLARRLTQHARLIDVDLNPETVNLLQWVMEGGTRSRGVTA